MSLDLSRARLLLLAALVLLGAGLWVFVLRGADGPADPELGPPLGGSSPLAAPGDPDRAPFGGFGEVAVSAVPAGGGDYLSWCLLAARTAQERARGLMEVTDLQGYSGMAFIYEDDVANGFFMRNTPTPLSIAWVAADGEVVTIRDMEPCEDRDGCPTYSPEGSYRYAIEVFQGDLPALGISEGSEVTVGGACGPRSTG